MADHEFGAFTPEQARLLWQDYLQRRQLNPPLQNNLPMRRIIDDPTPYRVWVHNTSPYEAPPFACMEVDPESGTDNISGRTAVRIDRPKGQGCGMFLFNSEYEIKADGFGWAYAWGVVRMRGSADSSKTCTVYGPQQNSWEIAKGPGQFEVFGRDFDFQNDPVVVGRINPMRCKAKWISFEYDPEADSDQPTGGDFYDGPDPWSCGEVEVIWLLDKPCRKCTVVAFHDSNEDKYMAVDTRSSMYGPGESWDLIRSIAFDNCQLNYIYQSALVFPCDDSEPTQTDTSPSFYETKVLTGAAIVDLGGSCVYKCGYTWQWAPVAGGTPMPQWVRTQECVEGGCTCAAPPNYDGSYIGEFVEMDCNPDSGIEAKSIVFNCATILTCKPGGEDTCEPIIFPLAECEVEGGSGG